MENIMYQEIDIKLNIIFLNPQIRESTSQLDNEIKRALTKDYPQYEEPMTVTEIESAMGNAHVRLTTSVDATKCGHEITNHITARVRLFLSMGIVKIETVSFREEAEIYGNK